MTGMIVPSRLALIGVMLAMAAVVALVAVGGVEGQARSSADEFNTLSAAGNSNPTGIWSDGTHMWVADQDDDKIYAYSLATKQRDSSQDFNTLVAAGNRDPRDLTSDGTTMWVVDSTDSQIYAYNLSTKARDSAKDFTSSNLGLSPGRFVLTAATDGSTMWVGFLVSSSRATHVIPYNLRSKTYLSGKSFNFAGEALWTDGTILYGSDYAPGTFAAYLEAWHVSIEGDPTRQSVNDITTLASVNNDSPTGVWSDRSVVWVADSNRDKIFAYALPLASPPAPVVLWDQNVASIGWDTVEGATAYDLRYRVRGVGSYSTVEDINVNSASLTLGFDTTYEFAVRAKTATRTSAYGPTHTSTSPAVPKPARPAAPTVTWEGNVATVSWTAVPNTATYDVRYRVQGASLYTTGPSVSGTTTADITLNYATTYEFSVRARNLGGTSLFSPDTTSSSSIAPPSAPGSPNVTWNRNVAAVSWTAVSGATSYDPDIASQRRPPEGCIHPYTVVSDSGLAMVTTTVAMFAVTVPVATLVIAGTVGLVVVVSEE